MSSQRGVLVPAAKPPDLGTPRVVRGTVTRHEAYGFYVDHDDEVEGLVVITMVDDEPPRPNPPFPAIGAEVQLVLLGYTALGGQPRLSARPSDLRARGA